MEHNTLFLSCTTRTLPLDVSTTAPGQNDRKCSVTSHMQQVLQEERLRPGVIKGGLADEKTGNAATRVAGLALLLRTWPV